MTRYLAPILIGVIGAGILVSLGLWQVDRLAWKEGILAEIAATIDGPPQPLPRAPEPDTTRYMPVALEGRIAPEALYVLVSVKRRGAGWRAVSAFETADGRRILLDRGFLPIDQKDAPLYAGAMTVLGNVHWPDDRNDATPENDVSGNIWYARDLAAMAEQLDTEPLLVVARNTDPQSAVVDPLPVDTSGIPNDHLQYAVTWFGLALVWVAMTGLWLYGRARGKDV